jgi:8-oxo-dGTP diphosphatase
MNNPFVTGAQKIIPAVLLYAFHQGQVLMLKSHPKDGLPGKWNGLGGKLDFGETPLQASVREFQEEASCETVPSQWRWMGQLYFPNFKPHKNEDWWVTVFVTDLSDEQARRIPVEDPLQPEGTLLFVQPSRALCLDLWEGDQQFLPLVFDRRPFQGVFFYEQGRCSRYELSPIR